MIRLTPRGLLHQGRIYPCTIGRGGLSRDKREGDGATPIGLHRITAIYHRADRNAHPPRGSTPIGPSDLWCDASGHPAYNQPVRAPFSASHERLRRADRLYDLVIVLDWNIPAEPDKGSAIFIHRWRRATYPTAGCIALSPRDLRLLAERITIGETVLIPPLASARRRAGQQTI